MTKIKTNERELASKVSEWMNEIIQRSNFPFTSVSNETGIKISDSKTNFSDLIIWRDRETNNAFSYIEIKPPFKKAENLETFKQKAVGLNVDYAFTWDFQNLRAYRIEDNNINLVGTDTESVLSNIDDWVRGDVKAKIKAYLRKILDELLSIKETGKLTRFYPDKVYFVNFIRNAVNRLIPNFEKFLRQASRKTKNKYLIAQYATKQGIAYPSDDEYYKLIARQTVYALVTKIIFYLTIRRYFDGLPDIYKTDEPDLSKLLKYAFSKARDRDWQAVFEEDPIEELGIPETVYDDIRLLLSEMQVYHFGELAEDVVGELFEDIIDPGERHRLGQYFTNEDLVDLILGFVMQDEKKVYGDPTCGSGTFLIRIYDRLKYLSANKLKHEELLGKIWGIDIGKFPAELSTINLFRQNVANYENFPRVICTDIFDVRKGMVFKFPPPNASKNFEKVELPLPAFGGLVGNFPFIRQELIEKKDKGYKTKLTKVLAEEYFLTYPKLFKTKGLTEGLLEELKKASAEKYKKEISRYVDNKNIELKLSGQADIYTYIFIHAATLIAENGTLAFITSNSWLDVSYGSVLKEFFLDNFKIKVIIASWAEPWFEDVAVNTVVTVLEKGKPGKEPVKFVKLKKKLSELIPQRDLKLEAVKRWQRIDSIVDLIETAHYHRKKRKITDTLESVETDEMRIRLIQQNNLRKELTKKGVLAKWGKYLRAPDVYFEILDKCKNKLIPLKEIAEVRFGIKTGINDFFYLQEIKDRKPSKKNLVWCKNARGWEGEIEKKYLKSIIKSPKESQSIIIDPTKLKHKIFICNKSKAELKKAGDLGALKYIQWGEKQKTKQNTLWKEVPSVQGRKYWWGIETNDFSDLLWPKAFNDRFPLIKNDKFLVADRLYEITFYDRKLSERGYLILNSTIQYLFIEINGRINLGEGALDNMTYEAEKCESLDLRQIKVPKKSMKYFTRKIFSIDKEIKQKERRELDIAVLEALGLNPREYLPRIYEGIKEMVQERLTLPKMRKKQKTQSIKVAYDQIKEAVIKDIIPNGVKKFPEAFYTSGDYEQLEFETYSTNGKKLKVESFFDKFELKDETGKVILEVDDGKKAEFAKLLSEKETYQIKIPKDEKTAEKIISAYKRYLKNFKKDLEANAHSKLHDWNLAEKMAEEIIEEWV
ncbi:putative type I restriction enzymeP M protein [bacterium BMS3Abin03]|nr:putative type I restriction enzymeP M protein [bacterium BMS3Abin03]